MTRRHPTRALWLFLFLAWISTIAAAGEKARVGLYLSPPFVTAEDDGKYTGMAVELWEEVAERLGLESEYVLQHSFNDFIQAAKDGAVDVAVTNLTVTHERAQYLKFSFPWYESGQRIMVKAQKSHSVWEELERNGRIFQYAWLALLLFGLTVVATVVRRRLDKGFTRKWPEGLARCLYDLVFAAHSGEMKHNFLGWVGYVVATAWLICGVGLVAFVTSTVTSAMTTTSIGGGSIRSVVDLPGKTVSVLKGSVADSYLKRLKVRVKAYDTIERAIGSLQRNEADAVVMDAPELEYWANTHPDDMLVVVGNIFHPDKYAFAANKDHGELVDRISVELIHLHEQKKIEELKDKYFGKEHY